MRGRPRILFAGLAALYAVAALSPCPILAGSGVGSIAGPAAPTSGQAAAQEHAGEPLPALRVFCPCGCGPAPPTLRTAGNPPAPPPAPLSLALPRLRHAAAEAAGELPDPPRLAVDHVPLPV